MTLETLIAEIKSSGADRNLVILRQFPVPKYSSLQPAAKKRKTGDDPQIDPHPEKSRDFPDAIVAYDKAVAVLSSDQQDEQSLTTSMLSYNPLTKAYFLAILWVCFGDYLSQKTNKSKKELATRLAKKIVQADKQQLEGKPGWRSKERQDLWSLIVALNTGKSPNY